jgi:S-adenosylmethionine decarboxylase
MEANGMSSLNLSHTHIDLHGAHNLEDVLVVERVLRDCVKVAGCDLIYVYAHKFPGAGGISGFALIAESHFSIHTWPELSFAAVDFFTCGQGDASEAVHVLEAAFRPSSLDIHTYHRGRINA